MCVWRIVRTVSVVEAMGYGNRKGNYVRCGLDGQSKNEGGNESTVFDVGGNCGLCGGSVVKVCV